MSRPRLFRTDTVKPALGKNLRELIDARVRRPLERDAGRFVQRNQVHLAADVAEQARQASRVVRRVVHAAKQHVLERDAIAPLRREFPRGVEDVLASPYLRFTGTSASR